MLSILKTNDNPRSIVIAPIYLSEYKGWPENVRTNNRFKNTVDDEKEFPVIIKKNSYEIIEIS